MKKEKQSKKMLKRCSIGTSNSVVKWRTNKYSPNRKTAKTNWLGPFTFSWNERIFLLTTLFSFFVALKNLSFIWIIRLIYSQPIFAANCRRHNLSSKNEQGNDHIKTNGNVHLLPNGHLQYLMGKYHRTANLWA